MRLPVPALLVCVVAASGCGGEAGDAPLPASGAAYRSLTPPERVAAAESCRDRAAAAAPEVASSELAKVDPRALGKELDVALSEAANRRRTFASLCAEHLPFVTPGAP